MVAEVKPSYTVDNLTDDIRQAITQSHNVPETVRGVREALTKFLANPEFMDEFKEKIPAGDYRGMTLYKDPELDFVVTAGRGRVNIQRPPHDHSDCWAVYGVYDGNIRMRRYRLLTPIDHMTWEGPAQLESVAEFVATPGRIDGILPGGIHDLRGEGDRDPISVIVRCHDLNTIWRNFYDLENNTFKRVRGSGG